MDVNDKLKMLLKNRGWTEYKLSKYSGLSESTIGNIFSRNTVPSISTLEAICKAFGITLSQFFSDDENELVELNDELRELFNDWMTLSKEQKEAVRHLLKTMNK
ncbi:MAG: helix-turn-helix domain-containing protein [Ruminiclostridium sp.]